MPNYPNIDAIAKCQIEGDEVEECLVYFEITTAVSHDLNVERLNTLDAIFVGKFTKRMYVALLHETPGNKDFKIKGDSDGISVPLYIGKLCSGTRNL